jgi:uncharacterized protein (TIGR02996 family)
LIPGVLLLICASMNEEAFLRSIAEEPASAAETWLVLADWLEERGDVRAELVRLCHEPRCYPKLSPKQRDNRIRALLAAGVLPCVPMITNSIGMRLALIPAGTFLMGSPESEEHRDKDEGPQHEVEITRPFYLGIHPVTQEQYKKVMGENPSYYTRKRGGAPIHPVEGVSWLKASEFCRKLSERWEEKSSGCLYRLPTEAEWEYACRGGATSSKPFSFGDSLSPTQANFSSEDPHGDATSGPSLDRTTPVGSYQSNAFGLYDMHGNVWEWCRDWYGENYYSRSPRRDPQGQPNGRFRVLRGGAEDSEGYECRSAVRKGFIPGVGLHNYGFRVVCIVSSRYRPHSQGRETTRRATE